MLGQVYLVCHLINLYGSFGFLVKHTSQGIYPEAESSTRGGVYGGSVFWLLLWGIHTLTQTRTGAST